jgi:DNA-binding LacI/PurR family transcriptional regulator
LGRRSQIEELLRSDNRPDAIHTTVWEVGLEVARIADRLGIRVPDDLLISTCGDSEPEPGTIGLTSLKLHPGAAATAAFDVLVEWLESGERPADREIPAQLVIRESTTRG